MIHGLGNPVVEIVSTGTIIELKHSSIYPLYKKKEFIENESPINGIRTWVDLWNHAEFDITVHLHASYDPIGYFNILCALEDEMCYFKAHKYNHDRSGYADYLHDSAGAPVPFKCTRFEPYYLKNIIQIDCLDLIFKSSLPVAIETISIAKL